MLIMNAIHTVVVDSEACEKFTVSDKDDCSLVAAGKHDSAHPVTLGKYVDHREAVDALNQLFQALVGDCRYFYMPEGTLFHAEVKKQDSRIKRKGGS